MHSLRLAVTFGLLIALGFCSGCSESAGSKKPPTFPVSGTVTMNGQPVADAMVVFVPTAKEGQSAVAKTNAEGKYQATTFSTGDGALAGEYLVKVSKHDTPPAAPGAGRSLSHEEEQKIYVEKTTPTEPPKSYLPSKYENESTSGLKHTVFDGPTTFDIKIE